ncbi:MAG: pyridoxamine 5'-phosphate oxidase family protein [Pseudomonadota bacterium]
MTDSLLGRWRAEQAAAAELADPMAPLVTLGTVATDGQPELRTLVLRWLEDQPALFVNATSPKWASVQAQPRVSLLAYWPSLKIQYRIDGTVTPLAAERVAASWRLRPAIPRKLDQLYERWAPQSAVIESAGALQEALATVSAEPDEVPAGATGLAFTPLRIERLALADDAPHDRTQALAETQWETQVLMP